MGESKHTPGAMKAFRGVEANDEMRCGIATARGRLDYLVATIENGAPGDICDTEFANAERFAVAWNACQDIPTEALEAGVVADMRAALQGLLGDQPWLQEDRCIHCGRDYSGEPDEPAPTQCVDDCPGEIARRALAKAEGAQ